MLHLRQIFLKMTQKNISQRLGLIQSTPKQWKELKDTDAITTKQQGYFSDDSDILDAIATLENSSVMPLNKTNITETENIPLAITGIVKQDSVEEQKTTEDQQIHNLDLKSLPSIKVKVETQDQEQILSGIGSLKRKAEESSEWWDQKLPKPRPQNWSHTGSLFIAGLEAWMPKEYMPTLENSPNRFGAHWLLQRFRITSLRSRCNMLDEMNMK